METTGYPRTNAAQSRGSPGGQRRPDQLSRIEARIAAIEQGSPAERHRLGEMLKALLAARAETAGADMIRIHGRVGLDMHARHAAVTSKRA